MNYIVFTKDLHMSSWENILSIRKTRNEKAAFGADIPDNYDRHPDFGFRENDDVAAKAHAYQTIRKLNENLLDPVRGERLREQLGRDVKNYIFCMNYLNKNDRSNVRKLLETMAELDCEEMVISIVCEYYEKFVEDSKDENGNLDYQQWYFANMYVPDYRKSYIKMGDRALFLKEDVALAMRCYALADLDWYGFRDEDYCDVLQKYSGEMKVKYQDLDEWHHMFKYYQHLFLGKVTTEEIQVDNTLSSEMKKAFVDVLSAYEKEVLYTETWKYATNYFMAMEEKLPSLYPVFSEYRSAYIIAHYLRDKVLLSGLLCLKNEENKVVKKIRNAALKCISCSSEPKLLLVKEYISGKSWSEKLWEKVLLFVNAIYIIHNIRKILQVKNNPSNMAYYTALETFCFMLPVKINPGDKCGRLSVMNIAYMNDPNEGKMLKKILLGAEDSYNKEGRKSVKYPYVFMKCFTSRIDDLPMWEMYGNHAKGCCLVLDWDKMLMQMDDKKYVPLYRVCYVSNTKNGCQVTKKDNPHLITKVKEIKAGLDTLTTIADTLRDCPESMECFMSLLEDILYLFKDNSYSYEEEMRIYYNYPAASDMFRHAGEEYPKLFVQPEFDIHLKEIIIGPKFEGLADKMPYIQEQVEMMCKQTKGKVPKITMSSIEYR